MPTCQTDLFNYAPGCRVSTPVRCHLRAALRLRRTCRGATCKLPCQADPPDRAVSPGRRHRHRCATGRPEARRRVERHDRGRKPDRCRRRDRHRRGRPRRRRRLHAAVRRVAIHDGGSGIEDRRLRSREAVRPGCPHRGGTARIRRRQRRTGRHHGGISCAGKAEARGAQLRVGGSGQRQSPGAGTPESAHRHRHRSRPVQGHRAGDARPACRADPGDHRVHSCDAALSCAEEAARPCGHRFPPCRLASRRAVLAGSRRHQRQRDQLLGHRRPRRYAARDRHEAQRRDAKDPGSGRRERAAGARGRRTHFRSAGTSRCRDRSRPWRLEES